VDLGVAGKAYIVFGGTRGMGLAAATALATDGASVAVVGRDGDHARAVATALSDAHAGTVIGISTDLTVEGGADAAVAEAEGALGPLSGLAVTTGMGARGQHDLLSASDEDWTDTYEDIVLGTVRACRAVLPGFIERGGGSIVTTAAYSIRAPKARQFPYATMKAAVATFTKDLAVGYGKHGLRANCVCPGAVETDMMAMARDLIANERGWPREDALERLMREEYGMDIALGRVGQPNEVGDLIAFLLSDRSAYTTGALINVDGGTYF
jgi:NAD(P)-dependent dehydrogenase (short-subunit alcohol dehydrogenase family)